MGRRHPCDGPAEHRRPEYLLGQQGRPRSGREGRAERPGRRRAPRWLPVLSPGTAVAQVGPPWAPLAGVGCGLALPGAVDEAEDAKAPGPHAIWAYARRRLLPSSW